MVKSIPPPKLHILIGSKTLKVSSFNFLETLCFAGGLMETLHEREVIVIAANAFRLFSIS